MKPTYGFLGRTEIRNGISLCFQAQLNVKKWNILRLCTVLGPEKEWISEAVGSMNYVTMGQIIRD